MQKGPPKQEGSSRSYLCDHLEDMEQIVVICDGPLSRRSTQRPSVIRTQSLQVLVAAFENVSNELLLSIWVFIHSTIVGCVFHILLFLASCLIAAAGTTRALNIGILS
jgi:hypothetical protein